MILYDRDVAWVNAAEYKYTLYFGIMDRKGANKALGPIIRITRLPK